MRFNAHEIVEKGMSAMTTQSIPDDVRKAFTTADFTGGAGLLLPESSRRFLRLVIEEPTLLSRESGVRVHLMKAPEMNIDRLGFGSRILESLTEDVDIPTESEPTPTQIKLETFEYGAFIPVSYNTLEDALEGRMNVDQNPSETDMAQTIEELIAARVAVDMEEILVNSDLLSTDTTLDEFDGALILPSNVYDHGGDVINEELFGEMLTSLSTQYLQRLGGLRFFVGPRTNLYLRRFFSKRGTDLGDSMVSTSPVDAKPPVLGVPTFTVPTMPEAIGAGPTFKGKALLLRPSNLVAGIWRQVLIETDRNIKKRRYEFAVTVRMGMKYEDPDEVVLGTEFLVAA